MAHHLVRYYDSNDDPSFKLRHGIYLYKNI